MVAYYIDRSVPPATATEWASELQTSVNIYNWYQFKNATVNRDHATDKFRLIYMLTDEDDFDESKGWKLI